jgi:hypothetical protein
VGCRRLWAPIAVLGLLGAATIPFPQLRVAICWLAEDQEKWIKTFPWFASVAPPEASTHT